MKKKRPLCPCQLGWIPVDASLPDEGLSVLAATSEGGVDAAYLEEGRWWWCGDGMAPTEETVTHWMPFPEPPTSVPSVSSVVKTS